MMPQTHMLHQLRDGERHGVFNKDAVPLLEEMERAGLVEIDRSARPIRNTWPEVLGEFYASITPAGRAALEAE